MKYLIVICVLIFFEVVASYPFGEEYSKATRPLNDQRFQFSNLAQPQYAPPGVYHQDRFTSETTRPYFHNIGAYHASNIPSRTGSEFDTAQAQNYDTILPQNQQKYPPVQFLRHQTVINNEFLQNQAKQSLLQAKYAGVPHFDLVDKSSLNPVAQQYHPVDYGESIGNAAAAMRPQYYSNSQNLPLVNGPPPTRTINIQKLQNYPVKVKELKNDVVQKIYAQESQNLQTPNANGNNDNIQRFLNNPKLREVLATNKNKKRYMVIYPNGKVEHLDSIENVTAQHPNHLLLKSEAINQIRNTLRSPPLASSNITPSHVPPVYSNAPLQLPANPLKPNTLPSPTILPPQATSLNIPRQPVIPLVPKTQSSHVVLPPEPASSNIFPPPHILFKSNAQSSPVVQTQTIPPNLKNILPSPVVVNTPVSVPVVPPTIPKSQKLNSESNAKTTVPDSTIAHVISKQKHVNELPLSKQFNLPAPRVSSDTEKTKISDVPSLKIDSNFPIKGKENAIPYTLKNVPIISATPPPTLPVHVPANTLPLTITEVNPKLISSNDSPVATSPAGENKSHPTIRPKDIHTSSSTSEENEYTSSVELVLKPIAMVSPTPKTLSAPIDLADLFPVSQEEDVNMVELSNTAVTYNNTTKSTELLAIKTDSNATDHVKSDTAVSIIDDGKQTETIEVSSVSTRADKEQHDKNEKDLKVTNLHNSSLNNSSRIPGLKSNPEERNDLSVNQTDIQEISDERPQPESMVLDKNESTSFHTPSLPEKPINKGAQTLESKNPQIIIDTTSATSIDSDENTQQTSSIIAVEENSDGKEDLINLIEGKKNMFLFTPPTNDEIWNKLLEDDGVTMVYFLKMPPLNNYATNEKNGNA